MKISTVKIEWQDSMGSWQTDMTNVQSNSQVIQQKFKSIKNRGPSWSNKRVRAIDEDTGMLVDLG